MVRYSVVQLNPDGTLDTLFDPGEGANAPVRAMAFQSDQSLLLAGEFTRYDGIERKHLVRIKESGSIDETLELIDGGPNGPIYSVATQLSQSEDGRIEKILVGGDFTMLGDYSLGRLARLNSDGTVDSSFESVQGADGTIHSILVQTDGKILIGGNFSHINQVKRNGISRLNNDGSKDFDFDPGEGADAPVFSIFQEEESLGAKIYIGGLFNSYNGTRRMGVARLLSNGKLDTSWMDTAYNQFAGLHKKSVAAPAQHVRDIKLNSAGHVLIGGSFSHVGGGYTRDDVRNQFNITRLVGGETNGPGNIQFVQEQYTVDENTGELFVLLERTNGNLGAAMANATTPLNNSRSGKASIGDDVESILKTVTWPSLYWKDSSNSINGGGWMRSDAYSGSNNEPTVTELGGKWYTEENNLVLKISDDLFVEGTETLNINLLAPEGSLYLGGEPIALGTALGGSTSKVTISDNDFAHGILGFSQSVYRFDEYAQNAIIEVKRIKGTNGEVSVDYSVTEITDERKNAAVSTGSLSDFKAVQGTLVFASGETAKFIEVPILDDTRRETDESFTVQLTNVRGGATIMGPFSQNEASVIITDNDYDSGKIEFNNSSYQFNESDAHSELTVRRVGGSVGEVRVNFRVQPNTALTELDYIGVSGELTWPDGDTSDKIIKIPLINNDLVEPNESFAVELFVSREPQGNSQ